MEKTEKVVIFGVGDIASVAHFYLTIFSIYMRLLLLRWIEKL